MLKNERGKWAVGDTKGNFYTQHIYDGLGYYYYTEDIGEYVTSKYIGIKEKGKSGIIDSYGQIVVMPKYDDIIFKSRNLIITKLNNKYGVFYDGVQIYETKYTNISEFKDNKAVAKIGEEEHFLFLDKEKELEFNRLKHIPPHRRVKKDENSNER